MAVRAAVSCAVSYVLVDVVVTTVLYMRGSHVHIFKRDLLNFNMVQSAVDLWVTVLFRASLLLGASIGVSWNREDGPSRVAKLSNLIVFACMVIATYPLIKMLMLTEVGPLTHQPWILSLICWTCASTLGFLLPWRLLAEEYKSARGHSSSSSRGGGDSEDTEKLVETAGEVEQEGGRGREKEQPSSGATLWRLLSYCRKDSGMLSVAIVFLIIAAVCECARHKDIYLISDQSSLLQKIATLVKYIIRVFLLPECR